MVPLLLLAAFASAQEGAAAPNGGSTPLAIPVDSPAATTSAPAAADAPAVAAVALFPVRAVNLQAMEVRAVEILFRRRYESAIGSPVLSEDATRAAIGAADDIGLFAACKQLTCSRWITIDLVRLDQEIFVTVTERDSNATVTQRIETTAPNLEAVPSLFDRIARALAEQVPLDKVPATERTASVPSVDQHPAGEDPQAPRTAKHGDSLVGFKFGILGPLWPGFDVALTHTFTWRRERADRFFEIDAGVTIPLNLSDARQFGMVFLEVGYSYIFPTAKPTAFYVGGGFGPRVGGYGAIGVGGGVYGQTGVMFARTSSMRPYAQLKIGGDALTSSSSPYVVSYAGVEAGVGF